MLIQFARVPIAGQVKTRLIPALGAHLAADLHCSMVLRTLGTLGSSGLGPVQLWLTGDDAGGWLSQIDPGAVLKTREQVGSNLGERMEAAFAHGLLDYEKVVLVGSDAPAITQDYLQQAAAALDNTDVVFGPAIDGGYVLLGMRRACAGWLQGVSWGTSVVLEQSQSAAGCYGLTHASLEALPDIDVAEDLRWLPQDFRSLQVDGTQALALSARLAELAAARD
ncbi:TIGR04282 family arsenosugar biosynthesis glycosyltransferase [Candidatus Litorirhabdus singularis]|uniref:TIGR04282 family arsenosugar biosynthesis glycosyltransferase n=1 Tax=Candidatus Litorirhabdus singularis TaxID=2518993 RepID=UPI0024323A52|nr:TIGR04282 family arsenosugar biosynthesis glycosyltransferase [Candidatus Litorirhabdus singularis]